MLFLYSWYTVDRVTVINRLRMVMDIELSLVLCATTLSPATGKAYMYDMREFLVYIKNKQIAISEITAAIVQEYLLHLHLNSITAPLARRKTAALRLLCAYLHNTYGLPDYSSLVTFKIELPVLCPLKNLSALIDSYKTPKEYQELAYKDLRNRVFIQLLCFTQLTIAQVVTLKKDQFCFKTCTFIYSRKTIKKQLELPSEFCDLLNWYFKKMPYDSEFIFCITIKNRVEPLSRQAAWVLLKTIVTQYSTGKIRDKALPISSNGLSFSTMSKEIRELYKKHPRNNE